MKKLEDIFAELAPIVAQNTETSEDDEQQQDAADELRIQLALEGNLGAGKPGAPERNRRIVEERMNTVVRVVCCTSQALKKNDPARYRRFLRGTTRAIRRAAAVADGTLSQADLRELKRRASLQRETDRIAEEFPDYEDRYR